MSKCPKNVITLDQAIEKIRAVFTGDAIKVERFSIETIGPQGGTLKLKWDRKDVGRPSKITTTESPRYVMRWLIAAHSQRQFDLFCKTQHIHPWRAMRVMSEQDVLGWKPELPMLLLPGYNTVISSLNAITLWKLYGGKLRPVPERYIGENGPGEAMPCPNDSDGDGDCHLCVGKGGCQWRPT